MQQTTPQLKMNELKLAFLDLEFILEQKVHEGTTASRKEVWKVMDELENLL